MSIIMVDHLSMSKTSWHDQIFVGSMSHPWPTLNSIPEEESYIEIRMAVQKYIKQEWLNWIEECMMMLMMVIMAANDTNDDD